MTYTLTIWLLWAASSDMTLVEVRAESCEIALEQVLAHVEGDGVTHVSLVSCGVAV